MKLFSLCRRHFIMQPRVAAPRGYPGKTFVREIYPERVEAMADATLSGLNALGWKTQGSSFLATLGYMMKRLRRST
jgi:hypothetical protein